MSRSIAFGFVGAKSPVTASVTVARMPPLFFFLRSLEPFPVVLALPEGAAFRDAVVWVPADRAVPLDCLAPPDAVRFPAAPLLAAVDDFEPPDFDAAAERAVEDLDAVFLLVPADLDAPVLVVPEDFAVELFLEPPAFADADLFPPWLDLDDDFVDELFAVAIG